MPSLDHAPLEHAIALHHHSPDALIEILHAAQQLYGYLSPPLLNHIARQVKLPPSRVLGVATFYHLFRFEPPKKHSLLICLGTACYAAGGAALISALREHCAGSHDWSIETGRCVGSCGLAPVAICDGAGLSRVTPGELERRVDEAAREAPE
jgi:bidirectional [NiFe] hydrogenase diaphorase subunit